MRNHDSPLNASVILDAAGMVAISSLVWFALLALFAGTYAAKTKHPMPDIPFTDFGCKCQKDKFVKGFAQTWKLTVWADNEDTKQHWERIVSQYPVERPDATKRALEDCRVWMAAVEKHYKSKGYTVVPAEPQKVTMLSHIPILVIDGVASKL